MCYNNAVMKVNSFFGGKNKKARGALLLIDVGSGSAGAALAVFRNDEKPDIVFETREQFPIQARLNRRRLLPAMLAALEKVINSVAKNGLPNFSKKGEKVRLEKIITQLSSPWHVSTTKSLHFEFEWPLLLTAAFIGDILSQESKDFLGSIAKDGSEDLSDHEQKSLFVEREIFRTLVNGYPVQYPVDKEAKEFEMTIFLSAFPRSVIEGTQKFASRHFPGIQPDFHSSTVVYFHVLKKLFPDENSFTIVHISGETTDVSVVKNDIITENVSFPLGRNFIVRKLMDEVKGITAPIALSMLRVHADGDALPKLSAKLKDILSQAESDWVELFADSMGDFSNNFFLPTKAFIIAGDDSAGVFADLISKRQLPVRGPGTPTISAAAIGLPLFDGMVDSHQSEGRDPFLAAEALFSKSRYFED
jgi:hypothetical protein